MKKNILLAGVFCLTVFASCESDRRTAQNEGYQDSTTVDQEDATNVTAQQGGQIEENTQEFLTTAASGGMMEVELGKIAQEKATQKEVKDFGSMMVQDHGQANEQLKSIAQTKNIQLPNSMTQEHQEHVERLRNLSGKEFDREYVNLMVEDHEKDIDKFSNMQNDVKDQEIKQWVDNTLPVLKKHKEHIDQIKKTVGA